MGFKWVSAFALGSMVVGLTGCKVEFDSSGKMVISEAAATGLVYSKGGAYPGPNGAESTYLDLKVQPDGSVKAHLKTARCEYNDHLPRARFDEVVSRIENSRVRIGEVRVADRGVTKVMVENGPLEQSYLLADGDTSYGEEILTDGAEIVQQFESIAESIAARNSCDLTKTAKYTQLEFFSRKNLTSKRKPDLKADITMTEQISFKIDLSQRRPKLTGLIMRVKIPQSPGRECTEQLQGYLDPSIHADVLKLKFSFGPVCQVAPGHNFEAPFLAATDSQGRIYDQARFSCTSPNRVEGYEALFAKLEKWLAKHSKCFRGSLL